MHASAATGAQKRAQTRKRTPSMYACSSCITRCRGAQEAVQALTRAGLRNPFRVNVAVAAGGAAAQKTPASLDISHLVVPPERKVPALLAALQAVRAAGEKAIVYFLTGASVEYYAAVLQRLPGGEGLQLLALHGGLKQRKVRTCWLCTAACSSAPASDAWLPVAA
jgi:hypothetical protein